VNHSPPLPHVARIVKPTGDATAVTDFDDELRRIAPDSYLDVIQTACDEPMGRFFEGPAKGEKWVPWHTVLGDHERYIYEHIYSLPGTLRSLSPPMLRCHAVRALIFSPLVNALPGYTDREKFVLMFMFRGSSYIPLFEALFMPILKALGSEGVPSCLAKSLIWGTEKDPRAAYSRGSVLHQAFQSYREADDEAPSLPLSLKPNPNPNPNPNGWMGAGGLTDFFD